MLTLDPTLQAQHDTTQRRPMIDIIVRAGVSAIPFQGNLLTTESVNENSPNCIAHSSGRICLAYYYGSDGSAPYYSIKYVYSDIDRTYFTTATYANTNFNAIGIDLCELADGNIGIVWIENNTNAHQYQLKRKIVTVTGEEVSAATINSWSYGVYTSGPTVVYNVEGGNYIMVYAKISGSDYYLYQRTSADFITWSGEMAISIGGLTSTWKLADPCIRRVLTTAGHDLMLAFSAVEQIGLSGEELTNIYLSVSDDAGANFSDAQKLTNYTQYSLVATHPTIVQKSEDYAYLAYNENQVALTMDSNTDGWPDNPNQWGAGSDPSDMHFDATNRKLYVVNAYKGAGTKALQSVVKIDVDTWAVDDYWTTETTPALDSVWNSEHLWWKQNKGAGQYVPLGLSKNGDKKFIQLIDGENDTIKTYALQDIPAYGISQNVSGYTPQMLYTSDISSLWGTCVDLVNNRLWILTGSTYVDRHTYEIGYISLADDGPTYTYVKVLTDNNWEESDIYGGEIDFQIYPEDNLIIVSTGTPLAGWKGICFVYDLASGENIKRYHWDDYPEFPRRGLNTNFYHNGKIYGGITYYNLYGQENMRGLCEIDLASDIMTYHRPTYSSVDNYYLGDMVMTSAGKLLIASQTDGIVIYDIYSGIWSKYDNTTFPGITPNNSNAFYLVAYDEENELIFGGVGQEYAYTWAGYVCFSLYGEFNQAQYALGNKISSWAFGEGTPLVRGILDYDATLFVDPVTYGITSFWINRTDSEYSIKWDRDTGEFSLNDFIVRGQPVTVRRSIDGSYNTVNFELSHGHLFDPFNLASAYHQILDKGNIIKVKFGENIDGSPVWADAGTFCIISKKLNYQRGQYPTISVEGADRRHIWKDKEIVATELYDGQQPDAILIDVTEEFTPLTEAGGDFDFPTIDDAVEVDGQWMETDLDTIYNEVLGRFNYFPKITVTDKVSAGKIAVDNDIDHTYANSDQILTVSPEDSFSDFTNRVVVEGQARDYSDVLYDEELVGTLNGTVGWWGFKKDFKIYYSKDESKRVRNPRLKVVETTTSIGFKLAGSISESLVDDDPYEHYCTIHVEAPSLIPYLLGFIALKLASGNIGDAVASWGAGWTRPVGTLITNIASIEIMLVLGACGNFQYEVYGLPIGEEKRSIQSPTNDADCNDLAMQQKIGYIVEKRFEEPFCYTVAECTQVARNEMAIIKAQRNRVAIEKVSHLQDEEGDTIRFVHPVSGQNMDVFVTDLTRSYTIPEGGASEEPSCVDSIEGWVLRQ